jgi:hypothetical protein
MPTVLFLDTNCFLQLKELRSLPWAELDELELLLLVPRVVQQELDRLKQDGKGRRSSRARGASSFLRQVVQSQNATMVIRDADPRVEVGFPPPASFSMPPTTLDTTYSDNRLVAEVLAYSSSHPTEKVCLLTADIGPMLTARDHSIPCKEVPETWFLDPEPDERDRKVQELRQQLEFLKRTYPEIQIAAEIRGQTVTQVDEPVSKFEPLSESVIENLTAEAGKQYPMLNELGIPSMELQLLKAAATARGGRLTYVAPTAEEINRYQQQTYPTWLAGIKETITQAPANLNEKGHFFKITLQIANNGNVPANNVVLEFRARGEVYIFDPDDNDAEKPTLLELPMPPEPPSGRLTETTSLVFGRKDYFPQRTPDHPLRSFHQRDDVRDRYAFYWDVRESTATILLRLTCEEFRHQNDPLKLTIGVVVPQGRQSAGAITCRLSAANLPKPEELTIPIKTTTLLGDLEQIVRDLIHKLPRKASGKRIIETV